MEEWFARRTGPGDTPNAKKILPPQPSKRSIWLDPNNTANDIIRDVVGADSGMLSSAEIRKAHHHRGYPVPENPTGYPIPEKKIGYPLPANQRGYPIPEEKIGHPVPEKKLPTKDEASAGASVPPEIWVPVLRSIYRAVGRDPPEEFIHQLTRNDNEEAGAIKRHDLEKGNFSKKAELPGKGKRTNNDEIKNEIHDNRTLTNALPTVASKSLPPALPPTVEAAYKKKCVALKQRLQEVEANNDRMRLQKARTKRQINKMRLERAILLSHLEKMAQPDGSDYVGLGPVVDPNSEDSSEGPPTPVNKPMRLKKSHTRRPPSPPAGLQPLSSQPLYTQQTHSGHYQSVFPMNEDPNLTTASNLAAPNGGNNNEPHTTRRHHASNKLDYRTSYPYADPTIPPRRQQQHQSNIEALDASGYGEEKVFARFYADYFMDQREKHGVSDTEELIAKARDSYIKLPQAEKEHIAGRILKDHADTMEKMKREEEMEREAQSDGEDAEDAEEGGNGGFTAVNG